MSASAIVSQLIKRSYISMKSKQITLEKPIDMSETTQESDI